MLVLSSQYSAPELQHVSEAWCVCLPWQVHPSVGTYTRTMSRMAEDMQPHLAAHKMLYVFGCTAAAASRVLVWLLGEIHEINGPGIERMVRACHWVSWVDCVVR